MERLQVGLVLGGRYELLRRIASGGMGDVWECRDQVLQRTVAVKVLRARREGDREFVARFQSEARHAAGLAHPNIAMVFDYGEHEELAFLVMELVDGHSLGDILKTRGRLDPASVRSIISQAALAVAAAHDARVIHRDIKPANVMVGRNGQVKLTDFGISRVVDAVGHTVTGEIIGTPNYLSPEQAEGRRATEASDIYALGVVAHELLTGARPFDRGTPVATILAHTKDAPPPLPEGTPEDLREVVEACLAKEPVHRPSSAREIAARLGIVDPTSHWSSAVALSSAPAPRGSADAADPSTPITPRLLMGSALQAAMSGHWVSPKEQMRDLDELLAALDPRLNAGEFAIVSVTEMPVDVRPYMTLVEPEGVTMLLDADEARERELEFEIPLAWITLGVSRAIGSQGYVPTLTSALSQARIASVAGVGRWHTHLFVPHEQAELALKVLTRLSRAYRDD